MSSPCVMCRYYSSVQSGNMTDEGSFLSVDAKNHVVVNNKQK